MTVRSVIGWGVVSTGNIAHTVAGDLRLLVDSRLAAVSSREQARADSVAYDFGVMAVYDQVEA